MPDLFGNDDDVQPAKAVIRRNLTTQTSLSIPAEIGVFDKSNLRMTTNDEGEVVYCFSDVLAVLTGTANPRHEMVNVKKALEKQGIQLCQVMEQFKFRASNGKLYKMWGGTRQQIFRGLQEVNSPRMASFKQWLSYAGDQYLKEQENPDLAIQRGMERYRAMGMTEEQAMLRAKSVIHRKELTDKWATHGISAPRDFARLTDRESKGVFGKTTGEMKRDRGLSAYGNLRDRMTKPELTAQDVADTVISLLVEKNDPYGYEENGIEVDKGSAVGARLLADLERVLAS